jgi:hypothetical protein
MWYKLILLSSIMVLEGVIEANSEPYTIEVLSAVYGDGLGHSCSPDISFCNGRAECDFLVGDNLCALGPDAASGRNLEVHFSCGAPLPDKAVAAAKGTRITLDCQAPARQQ